MVVRNIQSSYMFVIGYVRASSLMSKNVLLYSINQKSYLYICFVLYFDQFFFLTQVTEFEEGGMAIGLSCSHLVCDPSSATLLIRAWADQVLWGNISIPPFLHPLPKRTLGFHKAQNQPNNHLINHYKTLLESPSSCTAQKSTTIALAFTDNMVQSCINLAHLNGPNNGPDPSPFVALAGLLWVCISKLKEGTNGLVDMSIGLDMRKVLGLDKGFFGNCTVHTQVKGNDIKIDDLQLATKVIEESIKKVNKEEIIDLVEWLENYNNFLPPSSLDKDNLVILNLDHLDPYSSVFIKGYEPIKIAYYNESHINKGKILVLPCHPSAGKSSRIVIVTLPNDEAVRLCEDKLLARFSPTILMGPIKSTD